MKYEIIIMIVTASVFVFLLLLYMAVEINRINNFRYNERRLFYYYASDNLSKMEYDVASYDSASVNSQTENGDKQVTIEDVVNRKQEKRQNVVLDICTPIEDNGLKEIIGVYNPDSDS